MKRKRKTKINLSLIKKGYENKFLNKDIHPEDVVEADNGTKIYCFSGQEYEPIWQSGFCEGRINGLKQRSAGAIIAMPVEVEENLRRLFVVTFGHAHNFIRQGVCEDQFGIRVAINMGDTDQIRAISGKNLSSIPKTSVEQLSKLNSVSSFGIDIEQDMMKKITLRNSDERFGRTITGGSSLGITASCTLSEMPEVLKDIYEVYRSDGYKKKGYEWIDNIIPERDDDIIRRLNEALLDRINGEGDIADTGIVASPPEVIEWESIEGFSVSGKRSNAKIRSDIELSDFLDLNNTEITMEMLTGQSVYLWSSISNKPIKHWKLFDCLSAEIDMQNSHYVLSDGKWYAINIDYLASINEWYERRLSIKESELPEYSKIKNKEGKFVHSEGEYNKHCQAQGYDVLDRNLTDARVGGKTEICDLYKKREFVHVKIYDGSSAPISHLIAQSTVSGELFLREEKYRSAFNEKISEKLGQMEIKNPSREKYKIRLAIITNKDRLNLPFFSRVNLRSALKKLRMLGYHVSVEKIKGNW